MNDSLGTENVLGIGLTRQIEGKRVMMDAGLRGVFSNSQDVLLHVSNQLITHYPGAVAELFLGSKGCLAPQRMEGVLEEILPLLVQHCQTFPTIQLLYAPEHPYGMVIRGTCFCQGSARRCAEMCSSRRERAKAMLLIRQVRGKDVLVGGYSSPL